MTAPAKPESRPRWGWGLRLTAAAYVLLLAAMAVMAILRR
jgi:hypothetical protein